MAKLTPTVLLTVFCIMLLIPNQVHSYAKGFDSFGKAPISQELKTRKIIYTIKESESLWQIAKYFGIDPALLVKLNRLKNPDLIYPGSKLNIQVQDDFSLRVTETEQPENSSDKQIVVQVTEPSRNDIFAPENPFVEVKETISGPRRANADNSIVFKTLFDFVEWLVGEDENFKTTKAANLPSFDPTSSGPYTISAGLTVPPALGGGYVISPSYCAYQSRIPSVSSPPPKSL